MVQNKPALEKQNRIKHQLNMDTYNLFCDGPGQRSATTEKTLQNGNEGTKNQCKTTTKQAIKTRQWNLLKCPVEFLRVQFWGLFYSTFTFFDRLRL